MKYIPLTIILLGITIFLMILLGCSTTETKGELKYYDLLHQQNNYVEKSITIDDYFIKETC